MPLFGLLALTGLWYLDEQKQARAQAEGHGYGKLIGMKADLGSELVSNWSPQLRTDRALQHAQMARGAAGAGQMRQANWMGQHAYNQAFQLRALGQQVPESVWYASRQAWNQDTRGQDWQPPGGGSLFEEYPTQPRTETFLNQAQSEGIFV